MIVFLRYQLINNKNLDLQIESQFKIDHDHYIILQVKIYIFSWFILNSN